ncbi:hypothetical protein [Proteiniborus sp. MB09-C3]|uniref:hypothetical protein n=1 Tax=Proteiniborus sp. MB09-C3 TaxID=3050072 RepID=UPI0025522383|nr:hypothetical protein [Proteiniborus sp. MB09-C3]WIV10890.1 hypothetical protein QO263_12080 [Proteiniborus sp. MB09-C3]
MNEFDVLGFPLEEGLVFLRRLGDKRIEIKGTTANKKDKETLLFEPRIIRCTETESIITVVISYF